MEKQIIEFDLPIKVSTNAFYSGTHWASRKKYKDILAWGMLPVIAKILPIKKCFMEFEFEFKSKPLDCDNCGILVKLIIDNLRHHNKIKDDTPDYIESIKITSRKGLKDSVRIIIVDN